jgi:hypothetical protein
MIVGYWLIDEVAEKQIRIPRLPWFDRLRSSATFRGALQGFLLSFAGLLVSMAVQFARLMPWRVSSAMVAGLALIALLRKVDVVWVVLVGAVASALVMWAGHRSPPPGIRFR